MANELKNLYANLEDMRKKKYKSSLVLFILGPIFLVLGITLFLLNGLLEADILFIIGLIIALVGIILLGIGWGIKNRFCKEVRNIAEKAVRDELFPDAKLDPNKGFDLPFLLKPGFFGSPDRYYGSEYMSGSYKGIAFQKASYDLQKKHTTTDAKGHTTTTYITYAKGTMYHFTFERDFDETVKILEKQGALSFGAGKDGLKKVETEFIQFNKKFRVLASNETMVFYLLTPQIQEKIMELEPKYKGTFYLAYMGDALFIAVNDSGESVKVPYSKPISDETMRPILEFYGAPALFIDTLDLDSNKFKKNAGVDL